MRGRDRHLHKADNHNLCSSGSIDKVINLSSFKLTGNVGIKSCQQHPSVTSRGNRPLGESKLREGRVWRYTIYRVIRNDCRGFNNCHLVLQMQPHVISFYGVKSRIRFMFLLFPQVSRNWGYESEPPFKPSPLTCYRQFGTNSIIVLMFVESQRVHI